MMAPADMAMGRVFKDAHGQVNSVDFHRKKDLMVAACDAGTITLYDTYKGVKKNTLNCRLHGASIVTFTHASNAVLHASTSSKEQDLKDRNAIRYVSFHDNRYLRYFKGHEGRVLSLTMSPKTDQFMSSGTDKKVLMWDVRTCQAQAEMEAPGQPYACFDEEGLIFAAAINSGIINLYDARQYDQGPFSTFTLPVDVCPTSPFSCLKFSPDGKWILGVIDSAILLIEAFNGVVVRKWDNGTGEGGLPMEASFSCDGKYILSGMADRSIKVWAVPVDENDHTTSSEPVAVWLGHPGRPTCVKWSPNRSLAVSACYALAMWIPAPNGKPAARPALR